MPTDSPDIWDRERILAETPVASVEMHSSLPSTNDRALELALNAQTPVPHLVLADQQTKGRGRGQNSWWSSAGALTFSLLLEPHPGQMPMSRWPEMSLTVGSSICSALSSLLPGEAIGLKWPNDVYLRGAKLSGVLVEVPPHATGRVVIGVGLNVANSVNSAPEELRQRAIALCDVDGPTSRQDVVIAILKEFAIQLQLLVDDPAAVHRCWRQYDLLIGCRVTIDDGGSELTGTSAGIDDDGALLLRTESGTRRCYGGVVRAFV